MGEDPIGFSSRDFNFYRYVKNSPVAYNDADGLMTKKIDPTEELAKSAYCTAWKTHSYAGCDKVLNIGMKTCLAVGSPGVVKCQRIYKDLFADCAFKRLDCQKEKDTCEANSSN